MLYSLEGALLFLPTTANFALFRFTFKKPFNFHLKRLFANPTIAQLRQLTPLTEIACIEPFPGRGAVYARSAGVRATLVDHNLGDHTVLVELPSTLLRVFTLYSLAYIGRVAMGDAGRLRSTRFGLWRARGKKPLVRGVAKNPVDHPHGGRTKSIRYPRTP